MAHAASRSRLNCAKNEEEEDDEEEEGGGGDDVSQEEIILPLTSLYLSSSFHLGVVSKGRKRDMK